MQVEAIYENGKLQLPDNLKLKRNRFSVQVVIPDGEIDVSRSTSTGASACLGEESADYAEALEARLAAIRTAPLDEEGLAPLSDEYQERVEAFSIREAFKGN